MRTIWSISLPSNSKQGCQNAQTLTGMSITELCCYYCALLGNPGWRSHSVNWGWKRPRCRCSWNDEVPILRPAWSGCVNLWTFQHPRYRKELVRMAPRPKGMSILGQREWKGDKAWQGRPSNKWAQCQSPWPKPFISPPDGPAAEQLRGMSACPSWLSRFHWEL